MGVSGIMFHGKTLRKVFKRGLSFVLSGTMLLSTMAFGTMGGLWANLQVSAQAESTEDSAILWLDDESLRPQAVDSMVTVDGITFSHPGIYMSLNDLNTMQEMVAQGYDPWLGAFEDFRTATRASKEYQPKNDGTIQVFGTSGNPARYDADATYAQAVLWYITGDSDYLDNTLNILRTWYTAASDESIWEAYESNGYGWSAEIITAGIAITKMCFAAEILRAASEQSGWTEEDTQGFTDFLDCAIGVCDRTDKFMNQTGYANLAMLASAIFQNDAGMYREALMRFTVNENAAWPWCDCSLTNQTRLVTEYWTSDGAYTALDEEDYQIQLVEMGRDQPHAGCDVNILATVAQIAYTQGTLLTESGDIVTDIKENEDGSYTYYYDEYERDYNEDAAANCAVTLDSDGICIENLIESHVEAEGDVTDFYNFLDGRLLKAVNYFAEYNLGNEINWYPVRCEYSDLGYDMTREEKENGEGFIVGTSGVYENVSTSGRGRTNSMATLYYHYTYYNDNTLGNINTSNYMSEDENFQYIHQMFEVNGLTDPDQDFINNAELLMAPESLAEGQVPQGAPALLESGTYDENVAGFDRTLVNTCTSKGGSSGIFIDYEDDYGTTTITSAAYQGGYYIFKDFDFGEEEVGNMILTSASNSTQGCQLEVILLDDVEVADWSAVTETEVLSGEVIGEFWTGGTGWWTTMGTTINELNKSLSGTHSFALYINQKSDNVYNLCANLYWFAFADSYAFLSNSALDADAFSSGVTKNTDSVTFTSGDSITYENMDTDCGITGLKGNISATGDGRINVYVDDNKVASYPVESNGGDLGATTTLVPDYIAEENTAGIGDVTIEYVGDTGITISAFQAYVYEEAETYADLEAEDYTTLRQITEDGENVTDSDVYIGEDVSVGEYLHQEPGTTVVYYGCNTDPTQIAVRYRSTEDATLVFRSNFSNGGYSDSACDPYMSISLYDTENEWKYVVLNLEDAGVTLTSIQYVTVTGSGVDIDKYSYQITNAAPTISAYEITPAVVSKMDEDGIYNDYITKDTTYGMSLIIYDSDEEDTQTISIDGLLDAQIDGTAFSWNPTESGSYTYRIHLTDGTNLLSVTRIVNVYDTVDELIAALTKDYDATLRYSQATLTVYEQALAGVQAIKDQYGQEGETGEAAVEAFNKLIEAVSDLYLLDRYLTLGDGGFSNGMGDLQVLDMESLTTISDCNNSSSATTSYETWIDESDTGTDIRLNGSGAGGYLMFDFGEGFGVNLSAVYALAIQTKYYTRIAGMVVQGSDDLYTWTDITSAAVSSMNWQQMEVTNDRTYRYIRVYNGATWYGNLAEIRLCGECVEYTSVDLSSYKQELQELITELEAIDTYGYTVESYEELLALCDIAEAVLADEDATKEQLTEQINILSDAKSVLVTVENEIPLSTSTITASNGNSGSNAQAAGISLLFDGDIDTFIDVRNVTESGTSGWGGYIIFDLGEDNSAAVSEVLLAARNDKYYTRIKGAVIEASNDAETWTTITEAAQSVTGWQSLAVTDTQTPYRYLKIVNYSSWYGNVAELRIYSDMDAAGE